MNLAVGVLLLAAGSAAPVSSWPTTGFVVEKSRQGLSLRGHLASERIKSDLAARAADSGVTITHFEYGRHVILPDWWQDAVERILPLSEALHSGEIRLTRTELFIRGAAAREEPLDEEIAALRIALPTGFTVSKRITRVPVTRAEAVCDALFSSLSREPLLFKRKSASVKTADHGRLNRLAATLRRCPAIRVRIVGHSDSFGLTSRNQVVSEQRAEGVAAYLESLGVAAAQLTWEGRGDRDPFATNDTWEGRNLNRRVTIDRVN